MPRGAKLPNGLTVKEEMFCQEFFASAEAGEAYRKVYKVDPAKDAWTDSAASHLLDKDYIKRRLEELRKASERVAVYTADEAMLEAKRAYDLAEKVNSPAAMVSAVTLRAKLAGHLVDKKEVAHKTIKEASTEELMKLLEENAEAAGLVIKKAKEKA